MSEAPDRQPSSSRRFDTSILMAVAALLIINSHLESFYPKSWMAADGLLGVMIFYTLSGFGVQSSLMIRPQNFVSYLYRRFIRLYPVLIIVVLATCLLAGPALSSLSGREIIAKFAWPTSYTYYKWIGPFYLTLFFIGYQATFKRYLIIMPLLLITYAISVYNDISRHNFPEKLLLGNLSIFNQTMTYALGFFAGGALATLGSRVSLSNRYVAYTVLISSIALVVYVAAKFAMVVQGKGSKWFFILHLCVMLLCLSGFLITTHQPLVERIKRIRPLWLIISLVSAITLETYLVHEPLAHWHALSSIQFPLNIAVLLLLTLALSIPLHLLTTFKRIKLR